MTDTDYDLIVLGGGMAGLLVALKSAHQGLETALIEEDLLGGTCLNRGCIPTKTMIHSAEVAHLLAEAPSSASRLMATFGPTWKLSSSVSNASSKVFVREPTATSTTRRTWT